ncbi:MAG: heme-binding protein [Dehalococcoidia bacterium]
MISSITLEEAQTVLNASLEKARELGYNVALAVVDMQTSLVASLRMDGTNPFTPDVTRGKAMATAITKGTPSGVAAGRFPQGLLDTVRDMYGGRVTWVQGAVPLYRGDELIGAVAAGGAPQESDEVIAQAGADALKSA